jgi:hypothetical protein
LRRRPPHHPPSLFFHDESITLAPTPSHNTAIARLESVTVLKDAKSISTWHSTIHVGLHHFSLVSLHGLVFFFYIQCTIWWFVTRWIYTGTIGNLPSCGNERIHQLTITIIITLGGTAILSHSFLSGPVEPCRHLSSTSFASTRVYT